MPFLKSSICTIAKNEGRYILEWVAYHKAIGVDHIFIYDNDSSDNTTSLLHPYISSGFVTILYWPSFKSWSPQKSAYRHFSKFLSENTEWLIFLDVDEFINLKRHETISDFLDNYPDASGISINWRFFGDSGHASFSEDLLIDRFFKASETEFFANRQVKTFVRTIDMAMPDIHIPQFLEGKSAITPNGELVPAHPACATRNVSHDIVQINHYFVKSRDEWVIKRSRGKADHPVDSEQRFRADGEFGVYNRNEEEEMSIHRFRDRLIHELELYRSYLE